MTMQQNAVYLEPTQRGGEALVRRQISGELVMLNLLRFKPVADYSEFPEIAPLESISGKEAYQKYIDHTLPYLIASGGSIIYSGSGGGYFVGPSGEGWDMALLIRQESMQSFFKFAENTQYMAGIGHRTAALLDSRILPLVDV